MAADPVVSETPDPQPRPRGGAARGGSGRRGGLGRGLGALIPELDPAAPAVATAGLEVAITEISPNPYQPRTTIDQTTLHQLAASIRTHGVIQPLVVTGEPGSGRYLLIAGERRWRAAQLAGLELVPVVIKEATPRAMLELALVENVVRADLSPLEEAAAYRQLIDEFGLTQAAVAERVGRSRVSVTNTMRLLTAPEAVQAALSGNEITEGHARALLGLPTAADQITALNLVIERALTVRQTEDLVRRWGTRQEARQQAALPLSANERHVIERVQSTLGTRVTFKRDRTGGGALTLHFHSDEELDALYDRLVGDDTW